MVIRLYPTQAISKVPEVKNWQGYAGTAAPITFNGLVRQYYLRSGSIVGDLQVNLVDKEDRSRQSHAIALAVRPTLASIGAHYGASVKVVEVPPGPPVQAPIVAEIYGPDYDTVSKVARGLQQVVKANPDIVDVDTSVEVDAPREIVVVDRERAARLGLSQASIVQAIHTTLSGYDATYLMDGHAKYSVPVRLRIPASDQASLTQWLALRVRTQHGDLVPLSEVVSVHEANWEKAIFHKDLLPYAYVVGDDAGKTDSPLYGMFALVGKLRHEDVTGHAVGQNFIAQPEDTSSVSVKWDGEWQITYETFRDMGLAYMAGLVLIYLLVVGQFKSYVVPLIIMAPIPLTVIGVMPGHALVGAQYTATSMIGMIALAGIIVRNSILLIDFINHATNAGRPVAEAVIEAASVRAKPIVLTGIAAMIGGFFIIDDPIFQGLAVSLIFGILVSTILTLLVIPLLYYAWLSRRDAPTGRANPRRVLGRWVQFGRAYLPIECSAHVHEERLAMHKQWIEMTQELSQALKEVRTGAPDAMAAFSALARAALEPKALDTKTKELLALGIAVAIRCDACVAFHAEAAVKHGATREEIMETMGLAIYMGAGPSVMYAAQAVEAYDQFVAKSTSSS
jgi:AhpD family alkylhydroperoxidase